jgi:hypothetical protein
VLATVLGGGMSSRLFTEVRERRGLAYYVYGVNHSYTDTGSLHAQAGVDIERIDEAVTTIVDQLERIVDEPVPAEELDKAKSFAKGRFVLQLENPQGLILFGLRREVLEGGCRGAGRGHGCDRRRHGRGRPACRAGPARVELAAARRDRAVRRRRALREAARRVRLVVADEFVLDTEVVRGFVAAVRGAVSRARSPEDACAAIRPHFAALLADETWLPDEQRLRRRRAAWAAGSASGCSSAPATARCRSSRSSSRPTRRRRCTTISRGGSSASTAGRRTRRSIAERNGALALVESRSLAPGDFYDLLPPANDIHRVRTTSAETSVSIHLLTNDTGCVWRHAYDPKPATAARSAPAT